MIGVDTYGLVKICFMLPFTLEEPPCKQLSSTPPVREVIECFRKNKEQCMYWEQTTLQGQAT